MVRKIPGKKQKKVKDLSKIIEQRNDKFRNKINAPPKNPDLQDVPRSFNDFVQLKVMGTDNRKRGTPLKKKDATHHVDKSNKGSSKSILGKNNQLHLNDHISLLENIGDKCVYSTAKVKRVKKLKKLRAKKAIKLLQEREKRKNEKQLNAAEIVKDDIKFGEVVHKPPDITIRPRKVAVSCYENRPGRRDDLLLKSLLNCSTNGYAASESKVKCTQSDLKGRRKNLSVSDRRQLEQEREKAVLAYRKIKNNRVSKFISK